MDMKEMIKMEHLHKTYDTGAVQVHALNDINLRITEGEYVAIMGQSGSGKSTLMNILGCMDRQFEGVYELDGIRIANQSENQLSTIRNKKIGFVFQAFQLIPRTSALKNVEIPMIYAGMKADERRKKAIALLEKVGLGERIYHLPNELSGGQKQRVAIARAIVKKPPLLLADEPTGSLDSETGKSIMEILTALNGQGTTIVLVTHDEDVAACCKRKIVLSDGKVVQDLFSQT